MNDCIFCKIASGEAPSYTFWQNDTHMAFLSIFPNTKGYSVVIPKKHLSSYIFEQSTEDVASLMDATKQAAKVLDNKFADVAKCGVMFEGYVAGLGVDHLHAKLFPMHSTVGKDLTGADVQSPDKYFEHYEGYISSHDYHRADDVELEQLAKQLKGEV